MDLKHVDLISDKLNVSKEDVIDMNRRMTNHDQSLNSPISRTEGDGGEWQDLLSDERENQEQIFSYNEEISKKKKLMIECLESLKHREKDIIVKRRLLETPKTLEELSQEYKVSRERIRQIETRAFEKLQEEMKKKAKELKII